MQDAQQDLFGETAPALPEGMRLQQAFLSREEEALLLARIGELPLAPMKYRQYEALRRVVSFGGQYDFGAQQLHAADPLPGWLQPLRERAAAWIGVAPEQFTQALVAEYRPGTPLGWHRDVPEFEDVFGVSLGSPALLRFRPWPPDAPKRSDIVRLTAAPRSIYALRGPARWAWQHSVAPVEALRWSITFRTRRVGR